MIIVGLTGSIGMGKSATAQMFMDAGIPVFDSDATVHKLQAKDGDAIQLIEAAFPGVTMNGDLDRAKLGAIVFADVSEKKKLEAIIHPMVNEKRISFFERAEREDAAFVVLDVPLLFETSGDKGCHKVVVVSAPEDVQRERVLARSNMTVEKFEHILEQQTPDKEKRARADYVVETDKGLEYAEKQVAQIIEDIKKEAANA
tara:strand:+ start:2055 stop:2657 length:603 start_codon:yes stop_codon:yes gene_type:complete